MPANASATSKYFAGYAEPEAKLAETLSDVYGAAIVVPLCREEGRFLDGYETALRAAPSRTLLIAVVNGAEGASPETHATNDRLLFEFQRRFAGSRELRVEGMAPNAWLFRGENSDFLWLDRASEGRRLPRGEGVGFARKLGADLAAALWTLGKIECAQIGCSDADATLPVDYFARLTRGHSSASALLWPFRHAASGDAAVDQATVLYEISLRYYVLGLAAAGSPYAYQSMGSSLSFDAAAYASVRGFPKRAAAEDFYLLDKLAKIAPLERLTGEPLALAARASERVPFGTGRGTLEILKLSELGQPFKLYSPELFPALATVMLGLDAFAASGDPNALRVAVASRAGELASAVLAVLEQANVFSALAQAATGAPAGAVLRRRVHTWFDALRTLRFMHRLREVQLPSLPWREALAAAPFASVTAGAEAELVCAELAQREALLSPLIGPTLR